MARNSMPQQVDMASPSMSSEVISSTAMTSSSPSLEANVEPHERVADVLRRPGAYGLRTFDQAAAFFTGFDAALEWKLLDGFREWLAAVAGAGANLTGAAWALRLQPEKAWWLWPPERSGGAESPPKCAPSQ